MRKEASIAGVYFSDLQTDKHTSLIGLQEGM
jgi:hypothetical protein